jgi:hypothetical protein
MPKERLLQCQKEDRAKGLTEHHLQQLKVYFTQCGSLRHACAAHRTAVIQREVCHTVSAKHALTA